MGLAEEVDGHRVCIDTAPFIYFIEKNPKYQNKLRPVFEGINSGRIEALTSTIPFWKYLLFRLKHKMNNSLKNIVTYYCIPII